LRSKLPKRRKMVVARRERARAAAANEIWSLDFVSDQLANGTRFRARGRASLVPAARAEERGGALAPASGELNFWQRRLTPFI